MENMLNAAELIATMAHRGQVDKSGKDYISHPKYVSSLVNSIDEKIVALLHDTIEDTYLTEDDLRPVFGNKITDAIVTMTRAKGENYFEYIDIISQNELCRKVKIADLTHNMDLSRLSNPTEKDYERLEKYKKAYAILNNSEKEVLDMITGEKAIEILKRLKASAKIVEEYEDDIIADYRNMANSEMREIVETLLNLEI